MLDYAAAAAPATLAEPVAAVVDLDSLHLCAAVGERLGAPDALPALFISVYPAELERLSRQGPTDYLQPPFPPEEVVRRLGVLLGVTSPPAAPAPGMRA